MQETNLGSWALKLMSSLILKEIRIYRIRSELNCSVDDQIATLTLYIHLSIMLEIARLGRMN